MIKTIVVPLDGSPLAEAALPHAQRLAARDGATIAIVRAVHGGVVSPVRQREDIMNAETYLQAITDQLTDRGYVVRPHVCVAAAAEAILLAAADGIPQTTAAQAADMIVMSTHGLSGLHHALLGSVAEEVLRRTDLPVVLVQPGRGTGPTTVPTGPFRTILIPLDGTPDSERALHYVAAQSFATGATILLLHSEKPVGIPGAAGGYAYVLGPGVYVPQSVADEADRETAEHLRTARASLESLAHTYLEGRTCYAYLPLDDPAHAIVQLAAGEHVDLIAMTTRARTGLSRVAEGSVAAHVLHHAGVPVLLMRQTQGVDGAATPIGSVPVGASS